MDNLSHCSVGPVKTASPRRSNLKKSQLKVFDLLSSQGAGDYMGEPITWLEHSLQSAHWAREANASKEEILAALLHDIGHLCAPHDAERMGEFGVLQHAEIGARFLRAHGFSPKVSELVRGHVQAKRYLASFLATTRNTPGNQMTEASLQTLAYQGGPMSSEEMRAFEEDSLFIEKLRIHEWDEMARQKSMVVASLSDFESLLG